MWFLFPPRTTQTFMNKSVIVVSLTLMIVFSVQTPIYIFISLSFTLHFGH